MKSDCGHPSIGRYVKAKCRCDGCRDCARRTRARQRQERAIAANAPEECIICGWRGWRILMHETMSHPGAA